MSSEIFPSVAGLEYPVVRTPIFSTLAQASASGMETRAALQLYPRWQWTLSFNFLRDDANNEFRTLLAFFLARQGAFDSFLFDDVDDNAVTGQAIGIGDGSTTVFQLVRSFGGFTEPVLAPDRSSRSISMASRTGPVSGRRLGKRAFQRHGWSASPRRRRQRRQSSRRTSPTAGRCASSPTSTTSPNS